MKKFVNTLKNHKWFNLLLIAYLLVNIFVLIKNPGSIFNQPEKFGEAISTYGSRDASLYAKMAWQLINDGIYGYNGTISNAYVTPGQPFYLAAIIKIAMLFDTNHIMLYRLSNMVLNLGILILIYGLSYKLFNKKSISLIAAAVYATHISPLFMFRTALTEIPTIFLVLVCIYLFVVSLEKDKFYLYTLFGIVAAMTLFFRATPAPMLLLAWLIVFFKFGLKKAIGIGFTWCIGPILVFTPWVIRNYQLFGHMHLFSSHAGGPLLAGTNAFQLQDYGQIMQEAVNRGYTEETFAKVRLKEEFFNDIPLYFSWFTIGKTMWLFMNPQGMPDGLGPFNGYMPHLLMKLYAVQNIITSFGALLLAFMLRKRPIVNILSLLVLIYIVFSDMFLTLPRYGFLIYPLLCIIFAYGLVHYTSWLKTNYKAGLSGFNKKLRL